MSEPANVLDLAPLGVRVEMLRTATQTGGALLEFDVTGRARGFLAQTHIHVRQIERLEVLEGALELRIAGRDHSLGPGDAMEVPAGAPHRQRPGGEGPGRVRIQVRPAGRTEEFLRRLAEMSAAAEFLPGGWPRPLAGAALVVDFADEAHAARPSVGVQTSLARGSHLVNLCRSATRVAHGSAERRGLRRVGGLRIRRGG
jgi:mannose-6-phosphate isomerase-like protein (cupin superfamily)